MRFTRTCFHQSEARSRDLYNKVALFFQSLARTGGGAEKQLIWLASALQKCGFEVAVITWDSPEATSFYDLPTGVTWHKLGFKSGLSDKIHRLYRMTKLLRQENIKTLVGFVVANNKVVILSGLLAGVKMIASERNSPEIYKIKNRTFSRWLAYLSLLTFDKITVQFEEFASGYPSFLRSRIVAIANPIFEVKCLAKPGDPQKDRFKMLFVGRFDRIQKQPSLLIDAFHSLADQHQNWELVMIGDGDERQVLENQIINLGLQDKIKLLRSKPDISDVYCQADLFVIPSLWEGSPNALAEAMAYGLPAIGFEVDGVKHLIKNNRTGWLCPAINTSDLAKTLAIALRSTCNFKEFGQTARDITKTHSEGVISQHWCNLLLYLEGWHDRY